MIQPIQMGEGPPSNSEAQQDAKLMRRAIKERWATPQIARDKLCLAMAKVALDENYDPRVRIHAAAALIAADRLNLEDEKRDDVQRHEHTLVQGMPSVEFVEATHDTITTEGSGRSLPDNGGSKESIAMS